MRILTIGTTMVLAAVLGLGLSACEKEKGPAERLGAKIDAAAEEAKTAAENVHEDVKEAAEKIEKKLEDEE